MNGPFKQVDMSSQWEIDDSGSKGEAIVVCNPPNGHFKCLEERFQHGVKKSTIVFEAICGFSACQVENGSPMFSP